jgi:hypothetical protein
VGFDAAPEIMIFSFDKIPNHPANMQRHFSNEPRWRSLREALRRKRREVREKKGRTASLFGNKYSNRARWL